MKLLRIGKEGKEIPVALDKNGKYRNLSSIIKDLNPENINFENLESLKKINLESLEEINQNERIGSCITKPGNFFAIGLNYTEHAKETGAEPPKNPVLFNKSVHCIVGPNDNVVIPKGS
jgi:2-keto-4-pentenoate hydratase/2-oxohepta-3-ene-1,7-dioic acid hydratase in catechol pathway